jgi:hypothetical protein
VGAISNIAHGVREPGKLAVENVLGNLVPVVIDLLMSLLGVTGVAARVREIIHDLRQSIADAVDAMLQRVLQTLGLGGQGAAVATAGGPIGHPVAVGDKTMTIERQGAAAVVTVSGPPQPAGQWIDAMAAQAHQLDEHARPAAESHIVEARAALGRLQPVADRAANTAPGGAQPAPDVVPFEDQLGAALRQSFEAVHGVAGGGDVRTEAIAALRADFAQAHPANIAAVQARTSAIKSQFAPRGLTHLDVDGTTGGQVEIKAAASPPQSVTVRFNEVFSAASLQPDQALFTDIVSTFAGQGRGSETLAVVTVNGIALGGRRNAEEHAEQELIASAEWQQALARGDQIGTPDNKADLVLTVNRSPCKAICTGVLSNWLQANAARHPNIRFIIASTGRYSPAVTKEDMLEQLWTTLISLGYEPTVPFAVMANLPRARVEQLFREVMGPLMRETTLRHDEVTDQSDLSRLAGSGWQLRQLQVVASVTPARGALAAMLRTLGQDLGSALRVDV